MKRRSGVSTPKSLPETSLISQQSPANPSVTLFKLENSDGDLEPGPSTPPRRSKRVKVEDDVKVEEVVDEEFNVSDIKTAAPAADKGKKARSGRTASASPRKPKTIKQALDKPHPAPEGWRETYDSIKEMRSRFPAPVDTMGCDTAKWKEMDPRNKRLATLISLMLSSQTKDEVTDAAVDKLRVALGGTVSLDALLAAEEHVIADSINKVGFGAGRHSQSHPFSSPVSGLIESRYIRQAAQRLRDDFNSDVPKTVDELCSLPGVGPKMAFLCLHAAWDINVGIGVDVHVHRITNRLKWHKPPTKTPEETRLNLQSWLPTEFHKEINHLLVGFGQVICLPVGPRCDLCTLGAQKICPSAQTVVKSRTKKAISAVKEESGPKIEIAIEETSTLNPQMKNHLALPERIIESYN
ncbi:DNA glycosylase [Russula aff. rugulosa BPL654]|nr:DNA glycosylase [Russula aff. rugulosa BPL654]